MKNKRIIYRILLFISALLVTACTNDPQDEGMESGSGLSMVAVTRSNEPFTVTDEYSPIGVFLVKTGTETQSARFVYRPNETIWKSSIEVTPNSQYAIYGYAPADAVSAVISAETLEGATLTFSDLPTLSTHDVCFVVGVQQVITTESITDPKNIEKDIPLGQFSFTGQTENKNFVNLLMDHLYAGLKLQMTIDTEYARLRSIKIRKLELKAPLSSTSATVQLVANTTGTSPVQSVTYDTATGSERTAVFFEDTDGKALNANELLDAMCCFSPTQSDNLTLVTTYDVYDRNGNKISERTATNKLPNVRATRGERVTLNMTINPTYLYVLSDPDLDNPTVVIN